MIGGLCVSWRGAVRGGQVLAGRYRLAEELGSGGMGQVWKGRDLRLRRPVAVKLLSPALAVSQEALRRFEREAQIAAGLNHPGITTIFDLGRHHDHVFLVMELLDGLDLKTVLADQAASGRSLEIDRVCSIAVQIAQALAAAHEHGVLHRDIKPANLILLHGDRVKICDFGIARLAEGHTHLTATGMVVGTPAYMSPEQFDGRHLDARSDLYSLGCVVYELLTGQRPPLTAPILPPSTLRPDLPDHLDGLLAALLAADPARRPQTATEVIRRLEAAAAKSVRPAPVPTSAVPPEDEKGKPGTSREALPHMLDPQLSPRTASPVRIGESEAGDALRPLRGAELDLLWHRRPVPAPESRLWPLRGGADSVIVEQPRLIYRNYSVGTIHAYSDATIRTISVETGREMWQLPAMGDCCPSRLYSTRDGHVVEISRWRTDKKGAAVRVLDATRGTVLWEERIAPAQKGVNEAVNQDLTDAVVADGFLVAAVAGEDVLSGWEIQTGRLSLEISNPPGYQYLWKLVAFPDGTVVGKYDTVLSAFDLPAGIVRWSRDIAWYSEISAGPDGSVYVIDGGDDGALTCVRPEDGSVAWKRPLLPDQQGAISHPVDCRDSQVCDRLLLFRYEKGDKEYLRSLNLDGSTAWDVALKQPKGLSFFLAGEELIVIAGGANSYHRVIAGVDPGSGKVLWAGATDDNGGYGQPAYADGHFYWPGYRGITDVNLTHRP